MVLSADFIGAAFGAFVGFALAYLLSVIDRKRIAEQKRKDERQLFVDIKTLLEKVNAKAGEEAEVHRSLAALYKNAPYGQHTRTITTDVGLRNLLGMDRQLMLAAFRSVAGLDKGWQLWREAVAHITSLDAHYAFHEKAILADLENQYELAKTYDRLTQQMRIWALHIGTVLSGQSQRGKDMDARIHEILAKVQDIGYVPMERLHKDFVKPLSDLLDDGLLELREAMPLAQDCANAHAAYKRIAENSRQLAENLGKYAETMDALAHEGEDLVRRMGAALNDCTQSNGAVTLG